MQNNWLWLGAGVVIAAILVAGIYIMGHHAAPAASTFPPGATTTVIDLGNGQTVTAVANGNVTISTSSPAHALTAPSLAGAIYIDPSLPPDVAASIKQNETTIIAQLKQSPTGIDLWLQLGIYRKEAGDYSGAVAAWNYVTKLYPTSYIAYGNLGDIYQNFLKEYPQAESNYLEAIKLAPTDVDIYTDLYTLYSSQYKTGTSAAADIITQGLKANPGNQELLALQAQLQGSAQ